MQPEKVIKRNIWNDRTKKAEREREEGVRGKVNDDQDRMKNNNNETRAQSDMQTVLM